MSIVGVVWSWLFLRIQFRLEWRGSVGTVESRAVTACRADGELETQNGGRANLFWTELVRRAFEIARVILEGVQVRTRGSL